MKFQSILEKSKKIIGENDNRFNMLAEISLQKMENIYQYANRKLKQINSYLNNKLPSAQIKAIQEVKKDLQSLIKEPIIAKCVIYYEKEDRFEELYICNGAPPANMENVISYRVPKGRLAALDIGQYDLNEELGDETQNEIDITKVQGVEFKAKYINMQWDSFDTIYRDIFYGENAVRTIEGSLKHC